MQRLYLTHMSLIKETSITERVKFQFIMQISNLFNHPQFVPPSGSITVAGGNQFTTQVGTFSSLEVAKPRQITFEDASRSRSVRWTGEGYPPSPM